MQITAIVGRKPRPRDAFGHHARVAEDRRAVLQRCARDRRHAGREADMRFEADHAGGMDHAHHHRLLVGREAREIRLGADGRKGLPVDRRAIGFECDAASARLPTSAPGSARIVARIDPAHRRRIARVALADQIKSVRRADQRDRRRGPDARSPWRSRRREALTSGGICGASAAASARVSAMRLRAQPGAPVQATTRSIGSSARVTRPSCLGHLAQAFDQASCATASGAAPAQGSASHVERRALHLAERQTDQRAAVNEVRARANAGRGAGCASAGETHPEVSRRSQHARAMRPRPSCAPPDATNHSASDSAPSIDRIPCDRRARAARRPRARSGCHRCRARCGYRPAPAPARGPRRNRWQSRISRAGRAALRQAPAQAPPPATAHVVARVQNGATRTLRCVSAFQLGIDQTELIEPFDQRLMALFAHAADLQIGAAGQVDQAVAVTPRKLGNAGRLRGRQPSTARADAHHQPVARQHRPQRRRTPALDLRSRS